MTTENNPSSRLNIAVAIVIAALAVVGAFITKFESEASTMSNQASNDEQLYYYQAIGKQISGDANSNYEFGTAYQLWHEYDLLYKGATLRADEELASTYLGLRDELSETSKLLKEPYFLPEDGKVNLSLYKADTYTTSILELQEQQSAAGDVSSAWGDKSSDYVLQLTLLAVAGFLLGLALMTKSKPARLVFIASGIPMVAVIAIWAYLLWIQPVYDLRETGAIPYYANGTSLIEQHEWEKALSNLDQAIALAGDDHPYVNAYLQRAIVNSKLDKFEEASRDYEMVLNTNPSNINASGGLVWTLFKIGRFEDAIAAGKQIMGNAPDSLWLHHRVSIAMLAAGQFDEASKEYDSIIAHANQLTRIEEQTGGDKSAIIWQVKEAANQLSQLADLLNSEQSSPVKSAITDPKTVSQMAQELSERLLTASVAMEYDLDMNSMGSSATISVPEFEFSRINDTYIQNVAVKFSYTNLEPGQLLIIKVFRNGIEELAWEFSKVWEKRSNGTAKIILSPSYAETYIIPSGNYSLGFFVNGKLIQNGEFTIDPYSQIHSQEETVFEFTDLYDAYDFFNSYLFYYEEDYEDDEYYFDLYYDILLIEVMGEEWFDLDSLCSVDDPDCFYEVDLEEACDPDTDPDCIEGYDPEYCDLEVDPDCIPSDEYYGDEYYYEEDSYYYKEDTYYYEEDSYGY